jgi:segregation and condensation protein B
MDTTEIKHVIEAALLAARRPLTLDKLGELFTSRGTRLEKQELRAALDALVQDYAGRGVELKEVASGFRIQVRRTMSEWLMPLWEERAPRYTRALLETLALIAYRQPITRGEIEEVRGVAVSTNIVRTLMERSWVRVVGHRDVPGKPAMFGTTREFLDYFGLKRLDELPPLSEIKDWTPEESPQADLVESLREAAGLIAPTETAEEEATDHQSTESESDAGPTEPQEIESQADSESEAESGDGADEATVTRTGSA